MADGIIITIGTAHIRHADRSGSRRFRKLCQDAITQACDRARALGAVPITMVDDLSIHKIGRWMSVFSSCLAKSARREGISIIGGEIAQMPDTYSRGYAGLFVTVVSLAANRTSGADG